MKGKAGRQKGTEALERSPEDLAGPGGGGAPRLRGTRQDPGEGLGTEQNKNRKKLVKGPTKELQENHPPSKEPKSHRKDPKKESKQSQPE